MTPAILMSRNHPAALRMGAITMLATNVTIACIMGSYGVLIPAIEMELDVSRDLSSLGIPATLTAIAVTAPVLGALAGKVPLRLMMMAGALMMTAGFVLLALVKSITLLLLTYLLLIGPSMAINATIVPVILVMNWFREGSGRVLGIVNMPILAIAMPPVTARVVTGYGLSTTFLMLAALALLVFVATFFVADRPPSAASADPPGDVAAPSQHSVPSTRELLSTGRFWSLSLGIAALMTAAAVAGAHIVPMAAGWGVEITVAATLLSFTSLGGMLGSVAWGLAAEWLGGSRTLALLCVNTALWSMLLLLEPSYGALALLAALIGCTGGAIVPVMSLAVSQVFGQASLGRVLGLLNLVSLPCSVVGVAVAGHFFVRTGSYTTTLIGIAAFSLVGMVFVVWLTLNPRPS